MSIKLNKNVKNFELKITKIFFYKTIYLKIKNYNIKRFN